MRRDSADIVRLLKRLGERDPICRDACAWLERDQPILNVVYATIEGLVESRERAMKLALESVAATPQSVALLREAK